ncbi:hypothetical protein [Aeromonas enteropelogenes]|uniref:hypothetical protein n=1 Tax=Aeromonas enteropelogenes TaxID=29489 RepID=UPI0012E98BCC|nr:hypothetical protein [Aeromonas enteropelogenes]
MNNSEIIATSAAIIAFSTTIVSIWQGYLNRQYYRLSTRPHLLIDQILYQDIPMEFALKNNELGPAIIISFDVIIDDRYIKTTKCPVTKALSALEVTGTNNSIHTIAEGEAISVGEEVTILKIEDEPYPDEIISAIK